MPGGGEYQAYGIGADLAAALDKTEPRGGTVTEVREIDDPAEGAALFDGICRRSLGMSGLEFLARYDRGDYASTECCEEAVEAIMALPFVRDIPA